MTNTFLKAGACLLSAILLSRQSSLAVLPASEIPAAAAAVHSVLAASGEGVCDVFANEVDTSKGRQIVPLNISGNDDLIAFRLHIEYDSESVRILKVKKGEITKTGNLVDNLGLEDGKADIVWNNSSGVSGDGSLLLLEIEPLSDDFTIKLSYSEEDTFNENFEPVSFNCSDIIAKHKAESNETEVLSSDDVDTEAVSKELIGIQTEPVITEKLGDASADEIDEADKARITSEVNKELADIYGVDDGYYQSYDEMLDSYRTALGEALPDELANVLSEETPREIIEEYIEKTGDDKVTEENVSGLSEVFESKGLDDVYGRFIEKESLAEIYNSMLDSEEDTATDTPDTPPAVFFTGATVLISVCTAATAAIAALIFYKRRRRKN